MFPALFDTGLSALNASRSAVPSTGKAAPSLKPRRFPGRVEAALLFEAHSPDLFFSSLSTQQEEVRLIQRRDADESDCPCLLTLFGLSSFAFRNLTFNPVTEQMNKYVLQGAPPDERHC